MTQVNDEGRLLFRDNGLETDHRSMEVFKVRESDPLSLSQRINSVIVFRRTDWRVRIGTKSRARHWKRQGCLRLLRQYVVMGMN